jgi:uncharacterized protein (DUF58 family)
LIPKDIFDKVRRIEITTNRLVTDVFAGQYHSVFKGRGIEFDEVREYQPGDEMTVMLMLDASPSCRFASVRELKSKLAAEIAAVLAFSAIRNHDKIGLMIFTDQVEKFIPPRKGKAHVLRLIREALAFSALGRGTDLADALEFLSKVTTRRTVCFVISDFFEGGLPDPSKSREFTRALAIANRRHDLIAVTLNDPREAELPDCGLLSVEDAETGRAILIDTADEATREDYRRSAVSRLESRERLFRSSGVDHISVSTDAPYVDRLVEFFAKRRKRFR